MRAKKGMQGTVTVTTTAGAVCGIEHRSVVSFLGIPYGARPIGHLRFQPPEPVEPWVGVRDALTFGPAAPQNDPRLGRQGVWLEMIDYLYPRTGSHREGGPMGEDCLVLNVWTPGTDDGIRRPVMVWLHGGGFIVGTGAETTSLGDSLARTGDVVVVGVNHRLGIFGFLPLDELAGQQFEHAGLAGMLDIVLALEWVRDNIAGFGGDPDNVTIFGQSGGGAKVNTLLAMPAARGLFHKAINQSGPISNLGTRDGAADLVERVLEHLDLTLRTAQNIVDAPMERLLEVQASIMNVGPFTLDNNPLFSGLATLSDVGHSLFRPRLDDVHLPRQLFDLEGVAAVPYLIGNTSHDASFIVCHAPEYADLSDDQARAWASRHFGQDDVYQDYRGEYPDESARLTLSRIVTDETFRLGAIKIAEEVLDTFPAVYMYEFAYQTPILSNLLGATHSLDLPFVFDNAWRSPFAGDRPDRMQVARDTALTWAAFARTGNPTHPSIPDWRPYSRSDRATMVIDTEWREVQGNSSQEMTNLFLRPTGTAA